MSVQAISDPKGHPDSRSRRLEAWKEIASYLGRDVTTVRRWEKREGLPVHRLHHSKLGSVYAYTWELDTWRNERVSGALPPASDSDSVPATTWLAGRSIKAIVLGGLTIGLLVILAAGFAWFVRARTTSTASRSARIRALAVLPLENFSGNPEQDYLSDGMTEALISRLSAIHDLRVISRTSVMRFKGTRKPLPAIGKELNVDALIEGSVMRSGDKIRISVQLIRADTDEHLWSGTYDRELQDVLKLQNEVTSEEVLSTLERAYGVHPGQPRNHTKGTCALGTFVGMPAVLWGVIQQATTGPVARPDRAVVVNVDLRSVGARAPVDEATKRLVCFERRDMQAPLLGLVLDVGGEVPSLRADHGVSPGNLFLENGIDAERGDLFRDLGERVVRSRLPEPRLRRVGVIAEALFTLPQRLRCALLSRGQGSDKEGGERKDDQAR